MILPSFFWVYLKFAWLKTSKNSISRTFSHKILTMRRHFRTFWMPWRHVRWFVGPFWIKNNKAWLSLRTSIRQILDVTHDTPKIANRALFSQTWLWGCYFRTWKSFFDVLQDISEFVYGKKSIFWTTYLTRRQSTRQKSFFGVYLKFVWLKTSKHSTSRIFSRKTLTTRRHFRTLWMLWCHAWQMILRRFWVKNNKSDFFFVCRSGNFRCDMWPQEKLFRMGV